MAGPENNHLTRNWLVKSSTKIMGPFTREEVMVLLTRRQITIIDEVRQPEGRWNYIRENRYFKEVVKSLRYEQDHSKEDTMTSTATIGTNTITKTEPATLTDEFTPTPVTPAKAPPRPQKPALKDVTPVSEGGTAPRPQTSSGPTKSYGNLSDQRVQSKIQKQNIFMRSLLIMIAAVAIVFVGFNYLRKEKKSDLNYDQLLSSALRYKEMGLYQLSLQNYKKAAAIREPDLESQFQMVFLLINEDRQSLNGRRVIERALLKEGRTRNEIIEAHLGMALSYMMEGDLRQAEDYLQKTLGFDANNETAKINQAIILLKKGAYAQALKTFEGLSKADSPSYPLILLCKAMALIEVSKTHPDLNGILKNVNDIKSHLGKSHFLRKELSLLLIYLHQLSQDSTGEIEAINSFLEEPPNLSRQYVRDLSLDWRNSEWDYLERYCSELFSSGKGPTSMKAVRAVCLIESNRDMEAVKFLDESMAQQPKELTSLQAQAEYLWKLGRLNEAQILFQNTDFKQTRLALYVQGQACLKARDLGCAEAAYKILADRDFGDVLAHYGLAQVAMARKDHARVQTEIKAGFEAENNFAPLIELRDQMESP
ncbi:tetratricopeptide repeat protein [Bdellovibrio sp. HCB337]|uniref:tetratricopeptide repeat protein n=1 Tax=Bdellovibrio sp. HCB337 TaxID=3394358 RepID=UPI0039A710DC